MVPAVQLLRTGSGRMLRSCFLFCSLQMYLNADVSVIWCGLRAIGLHNFKLGNSAAKKHEGKQWKAFKQHLEQWNISPKSLVRCWVA